MNKNRTRRLIPSLGLYLIGTGLVAAALAWVAWTWTSREHALHSNIQARASEIQKGPHVQFVAVAQSPDTRSISFLGEAKPFQEVTLYAKLSGYVQKINVDKGDKVTPDQVLAIIDSPETDKQYRAAKATLENKRSFLKRAESLGQLKFFSPQAVEDAKRDERIADAQLAGIADLKNYQVIKAPFAGTVTARFVDPGALVQNAQTTQTAATPIVTVSQTSKLRIYIYVDQNTAPLVHVGAAAEIVDPARPGKVVTATVARMTGQFDPRTRTLLTEIDVDNPDGALLPGSFVQVSIKSKTESFLEIPAPAVVLRGNKPFVGIIGQDDRLHYRPVSIVEHDGTTVRIRDGIAKGERAALNVGDAVEDGGKVRPVAAAAQK